MAEAKLSEESLLQETGGAEAVVIPANLENTKVQLSSPSLPAELQAKKREADKYPGTVPKALEAESPFAKVKDKEKPLSELGRASWGWEWQRSPDKAAPPHPRMRDEAEDYQHQGWPSRAQHREERAEREEPPQFRGKFDGDPDNLAQFLDSAEIYIEQFGHLYPFPRALVNAISEGLEGEAKRWSASLYKYRAPQLQNADGFLQLWRARYEEEEEDPYVEDELRNLMQRGKPIREHIREFRRVIGTLPPLPERLLVYFFRTSLDKRISQVTAYRDIPNRLAEGFRVAIKVDRGLRASDTSKPPEGKERGRPDQGPLNRRETPTSQPSYRPTAPRSPLKCYRCGGSGHIAARCGTPRPGPAPPPKARPERGPKRVTHVPQEAPQIPEFFAHLTETRGIPDEGDQFPEPYDTEDKGEDDPMVMSQK
ncbi:uncharacterized protein LOC132710478 [Pantherophis guttatus]|uniref:Uncharacterized protein LOC132710478 n=1 Tax=Pantherophis guttatus TaxID=94885 RepID=A0ABM3Z2T5_PANGU|nr:uncharacterized protein LOC132710478 [Pantherophis guttatus]